MNGKKLWIKDFCDFQYGVLVEENITNKPHQSYINLLKKHSLWIDYIKTIHSHKEKEKDKDKDKDKEIDKEYKCQFNEFRQNYPGTKRGNDIEFDNLIKRHKDWKDIIPILSKRIEYQIEARSERKNKNLFVPEWKNLQTWINQRCWEELINTEQ